MKIVHVIDSLATGGAERVVVDLVKYGIELGHDVSIVLLAEIDGLPHALAEKYKIPVKILSNSLKDPRNIFRIRKATMGADIVHVHLFPAFYWSAFVPNPKVFTEHSSHNNRMGKRSLAWLERWVYTQYDRIIAISDGVEESLNRHFQLIGADTPIILAANGTTRDFFAIERTYSNNPTRLAIIGSLKPVKQHEVAIRAISLLDNITLDIAGEGDLRDDLEKLVSKLGLESRVKFLGNVDNIPELLERTDLLLSTSAYEGMSTVAVEAQASGIPVVGPDVPGIRDVVVHSQTGLLYSDHDPKIVASTIRRALAFPTYTKLAEATRRHARQYSIENSFAAQLKVYKSALYS